MAGTTGTVIIDALRCRGCGLCILACPAGCLAFAEDYDDRGYHPVRYSGEGCRGDGLCFDACPRPGAIVVTGDHADAEIDREGAADQGARGAC